METVQLKINGRVQGVFYRHSTREKAISLGLSGWVANMDDGSVEAEVTGATEKIDELIAWCKVGPPSAQVQAVEIEWRRPASQENQARGFEVR